LWVRDVAPPDFAVDVAAQITPTVTFARALDPTSVDGSTVLLVNGRTGAAVAATVVYDPVTNSVTLRPASALDSGTPYRIVIGAVRDHTGAVHTGRSTSTFRTAGQPIGVGR
jgi:hypothetical protein